MLIRAIVFLSLLTPVVLAQQPGEKISVAIPPVHMAFEALDNEDIACPPKLQPKEPSNHRNRSGLAQQPWLSKILWE